jgi:endonuclease/exonuclease/phosphatase (EEP) superfamily protein YafD
VLLLQCVGWPFLGVLAASRLSGARRSGLLDFFDTWRLYALAPFPALAALGVALRSPGLILLGGLGSAWLRVVAWAARGQTHPYCIRRDLPRLRVLTANVLGGNSQPEALAALVEREQPDVIALQEVRAGFGTEIVRLLAQTHPYVDLRPHARNYGGALLSRLPLEEVEAFRLARRGAVCQRARVQVEGEHVEIFNVHLDTPFEIFPRHHGLLPFGIRHRTRNVRDVEVERLLELVAPIDHPLIVLGDFNTSAGSRPYRRLRRGLRDAFAEVGRGSGHTFPQPVPIHGLVLPWALLRIDYAWFKGALSPREARTLRQLGSDHFALLVNFVVLERTRATRTGAAWTLPTAD